MADSCPRFVVRESTGYLSLGPYGSNARPASTFTVLDSHWLYRIVGLFRQEDERGRSRTRATMRDCAHNRACELAALLNNEQDSEVAA
jgi:hypothetical protein